MTNRKSKKFRKSEEKPTRKEVRAKTDGQQWLIDSINEMDIVICTGPAGTGKTTVSAGLAAEFLLDPDVNISKVLITRPIVECGKRMGALPGSEKEKVHPYLIPVLEELEYYIPPNKLRDFQNHGDIKIVPLETMRGRNFHNTFMILDEAQNADKKQIKNFLTRIGMNSVAVLNGDITQTDLRGNDADFAELPRILEGLEGVEHVELTDKDVVRSDIVKRIIGPLNTWT